MQLSSIVIINGLLVLFLESKQFLRLRSRLGQEEEESSAFCQTLAYCIIVLVQQKETTYITHATNNRTSSYEYYC